MKLKLLITFQLIYFNYSLDAQQLFTNKFSRPQRTALLNVTESISDSAYYFTGYTLFKDSLNHFFSLPSILKTNYSGDVKSYFEYRINGTFNRSGFSHIKSDSLYNTTFICGGADGYDTNFIYGSRNFIGQFLPNGNLINLKEIYYSNNDAITTMLRTMDGGFLLSGVTDANNNSNFARQHFVVKFDSVCIQQWAKIFYDTTDCEGAGAFQLPDSDYIITGFKKWTDSTLIGNNWYVLRIDKAGNVIWGRKTNGNLETVGRGGGAFTKTIDSNLVIGYPSFYTAIGNSYMSLLKMDLTGNLIWHRFLNSDPYTIIALPDSGFILPGITATKLDALGNVQYTIYQNYSFQPVFSFGIKTRDNCILTAGAETNGSSQPINALIAKRDMSGNAACHNAFTPNYFSLPSGISFTNLIIKDSNVVFNERSISYFVYDSIPVLEDICLTSINETGSKISTAYVYPNPFENSITLESSERVNSVEIFDLMGKSIFKVICNKYIVAINDLPETKAGIYFVKIETDSGFLFKKLIKSF